ncbi:hypothetical protein AVEN_130251-1, partial [Araneus ventricosus]
SSMTTKSNKKNEKRHKMNTNEERRRSELQNTLPLRSPFTAQKLRRKKPTLSAFTLDWIWAARSSRSAGSRSQPERGKDALFNIFFFFSYFHGKW